MPTSQRVLSGSITKGSKATLTGSAEYYYQGINSKDISSYFGSLIPRAGSGDRTKLYKLGSPVSEVSFDDSIILNNTSDDMGGENDTRLEQRINFDFENRNFGQPPTTMQGTFFADALDFDPVKYIQDNDEVMWPVNLWNMGTLTDHEYDGVIEPFDIRREILGDFDLRYDGKTIRGALVGAASERPWGSLQIKDSWKINDAAYLPFLDSPDAMTLEDDTVSLQAYQDIRQSADNGFAEKEYHDVLYGSLRSHNSSDMMSALKRLNSSSCATISDPYDKRSTRGFYFGDQAGSITFGDMFIVGEYE